MISASVLFLLSLGAAGLAFADETPHLFMSPGDMVKLEIRQRRPVKFRLCAENQKFEFCSQWKPPSGTVEIDLKIPSNAPSGDYRLMYEDEKGRVDLKHHFNVEEK